MKNLKTGKIYQGDVVKILKTFPSESVDCIVTSPPYYGLRDYGEKGQLGLEPSLDLFIENMLAVTAELHRVLKPTGTMFWNHGDSYGASIRKGGDNTKSAKQKSNRGTRQGVRASADKCLSLQAYRLAIRMTDEQGWILRNTLIWHKPNCMPQSVKDRFTVDYEPVFFFTKSKRYYFEQQFEPFKSNDYDRARMANARTEYRTGKWSTHADEGAVKQQRAFVAGNKEGRTKRCVWSINTKGNPDAHFAVFPEALIETPIKAGCPEGGIVLDPFMGSGTTAQVARMLRREWVGVELNPDYIKIAEARMAQQTIW